MNKSASPTPAPDDSEPAFTCHYCGQKKVGLQGR